MRLVLSPYQYNMLRLIRTRKHFSREEAAEYLQPTFTSMVKRGYLVWNGKEDGFCIAPAANLAMNDFESAEIHRRNAKTTLSQFLESYVSRHTRAHRRSA